MGGRKTPKQLRDEAKKATNGPRKKPKLRQDLRLGDLNRGR